MEAGIGRMATRWIGMLEMTCLIKIRQPAKDRDLAFQAEGLELTTSSRRRKWLLCGVPKQIGAPRLKNWLATDWYVSKRSCRTKRLEVAPFVKIRMSST
ncbi:hypothetical protein AAC387_Pa04g0853 [Persea americana]